MVLPLGTLVLGTKVATYSYVRSLLHNSTRCPSEGRTETQRDLVRRLTFGQDGCNIRRAECSETILRISNPTAVMRKGRAVCVCVCVCVCMYVHMYM